MYAISLVTMVNSKSESAVKQNGKDGKSEKQKRPRQADRRRLRGKFADFQPALWAVRGN